MAMVLGDGTSRAAMENNVCVCLCVSSTELYNQWYPRLLQKLYGCVDRSGSGSTPSRRTPMYQWNQSGTAGYSRRKSKNGDGDGDGDDIVNLYLVDGWHSKNNRETICDIRANCEDELQAMAAMGMGMGMVSLAKAITTTSRLTIVTARPSQVFST